MKFSVARIFVTMASAFREPCLQLGVMASDVMEHFYRAILTPDRVQLKDLITSGGNSYADLRLIINTFKGGGRIEITPGALVVELKELFIDVGHAEVAREHFQLCEDTARKAINGLDISERLIRASMWLSCEGGRGAAASYLSERGNAAFRLDQGVYAALTKEFTLKFNGLNTTKAAKIGLLLEPSSVPDADLFLQFDYTYYGNPAISAAAAAQFDEGAKELQALFGHLGLEPKTDNVGKP